MFYRFENLVRSFDGDRFNKQQVARLFNKTLEKSNQDDIDALSPEVFVNTALNLRLGSKLYHLMKFIFSRCLPIFFKNKFRTYCYE